MGDGAGDSVGTARRTEAIEWEEGLYTGVSSDRRWVTDKEIGMVGGRNNLSTSFEFVVCTGPLTSPERVSLYVEYKRVTAPAVLFRTTTLAKVGDLHGYLKGTTSTNRRRTQYLGNYDSRTRRNGRSAEGKRLRHTESGWQGRSGIQDAPCRSKENARHRQPQCFFHAHATVR